MQNWNQEGVTSPRAKADGSSWKVPLMMEPPAHRVVSSIYLGAWTRLGEKLDNEGE